MNEAVVNIGETTLAIERTIDAPRSAIWRCWTEPDLLKRWFCPKPWAVDEIDFDVRPGGRMNLAMVGPDRERVESVGCWLEVVPETSAVFTDFFSEGYVPKPDGFMVGAFALADAGGGATRLRWEARHKSAEDAKAHLQMGFESGWTASSAQLAELACRTGRKGI